MKLGERQLTECTMFIVTLEHLSLARDGRHNQQRKQCPRRYVPPPEGPGTAPPSKDDTAATNMSTMVSDPATACASPSHRLSFKRSLPRVAAGNWPIQVWWIRR